MKNIKYLIILLLSMFALKGNAQGYKIILKDGRTATVRADETEIITFSQSVSTKEGTMPGYKIILSDGRNLTIGTEETEIFTFTTDAKLITNISAFETVNVSSISLSNTSLAMIEGDETTLTATVQPSNASDKTLVWKSDNPNVVSVDNDGLVIAKAPGTATITVSAADGSGVSATCSVTVSAAIINVTGISLSSTSLSMVEGNTVSLTSTVTPSNATNKSVIWTSSNTNVAKVNDSGLVTAISEGSATITATAADGSGVSASCKVYVESAIVYVSSISLSNTSVSLTEGDTKYLTYTISPSNATNKEVTWSSSNTSVASVDAFGMITARSVGSATITATAKDGSGVKANCSVSVKSSVPDKSPSGAKAVDLGLSVKWANMNVGATEVSGYGDYFAWGETSPKATYTIGNYKFYKTTSYVNSNGYMVEKHGNIKYVLKDDSSRSGWDGFYDDKEVLDKEDDAAYMNWGGEWRMPTKNEQQELVDKCKWDLTTLNGVIGCKVTGPNGNYIFLPAAGLRVDSASIDVGSFGYYWSSSLNSDYSYQALSLYFSSYGVSWYFDSRFPGRTVRPVCP